MATTAGAKKGLWSTIRRIAASDRISGLIMLGFALTGLVLANLPATAHAFETVAETHLFIPYTNLDLPIGHWAQDGLLTIFFLTVGLTFGIKSGKITNGNVAVKMMGESVKSLAGFMVMVFAIAQFIAAFGWSNIATIVATNGAQYLKDINMTGLPALLGFMLFGQCIALFVASGSAIWAMLSPVFVPMFMLLGYHPAFVQLAFRAGDTSLNSIMLVNPFLPLFIDMLQKYKSESGIGTYLSLMVPYAFTYMASWYLLFSVWYFFDLPIGPGIGQRLM